MSQQAITDGDIRLTARDGFSFDAYRAAPAGEAIGGLVILQEIFGVTDQLKSVARRYAQNGFVCIVPALFDRAAPGTVLPFTEGAKGRDMAMALDPAGVAMDAGAALEAADTGRGASLLGFCWGGGQALRLTGEMKPVSAVAFYGTRLTSFLDRQPKCPMLFHFAEHDDHSPPDVIAAVRAALREAETYVYPAGHAFANEARPNVYVEDEAEKAHARTLAFLTRQHGERVA